MKYASRIDSAPPYLFIEIEKKIKEAKQKGIDVISLAVGDPDIKTPDFIVKAMSEAVTNPKYHVYPEYDGGDEFLDSVKSYYKRRYNVNLDIQKNINTLIGSKEGIANMFLAYIEDGDYAVLPDPQYPIYNIMTLFAGGKSYFMPLLEKNNFLPDLDAIPEEVLKKAKLILVNYPNNPTGATANLEFYKKLVALAKKYNIVVCNDNAYGEITYDGFVAPSILEVEGAMDVAIEFGSLSKSYNMTGWRIGYVVGSEEVISKIKKVKHNVDSGVFTAIQIAGAEALDHGDSFIKEMINVYDNRRKKVIKYLDELGLQYAKTNGAFYIWCKVPSGYTSIDFVSLLLEKCGVAVSAGVGFGSAGEGYIRFSLTVPDARIDEAFERMRQNLLPILAGK